MSSSSDILNLLGQLQNFYNTFIQMVNLTWYAKDGSAITRIGEGIIYITGDGNNHSGEGVQGCTPLFTNDPIEASKLSWTVRLMGIIPALGEGHVINVSIKFLTAEGSIVSDVEVVHLVEGMLDVTLDIKAPSLTLTQAPLALMVDIEVDITLDLNSPMVLIPPVIKWRKIRA